MLSFKINLSFINIIEKQNANYKLNGDSSLLYAARWSKYWIYCNQDIIKWKLILLSVHLVFADNSIDETAATWLCRPPNTHTYLIMRSYFSPLQSDRACIVSYTYTEDSSFGKHSTQISLIHIILYMFGVVRTAHAICVVCREGDMCLALL